MDATVVRPLRVGLFLPTWTPGEGLPAWTSAAYPDGPSWRDILATARLAEDAGFDSLWACDHMLMDEDWDVPDDRVLGPAAVGNGTWDVWAVLAGLASATSRIGLGTLVACTAYQNPARLARLADTIDEISGGRLILGLGAGDHWSEFRRFGVAIERPIARFEEALRIIVPLLREGRVDFEGEFYAARDCQLSPRGRSSGPPVLIGALGSGPRMLRLVATYADLWNGWYSFNDEPPLPTLEIQQSRLDEACVAHGRDPRTMGRTAGVSVALPGFEGSGGSLRGTHEQIAEQLLAIGATGIGHVSVVTSPTGPAGVEGMARVLEHLDRTAAPATR
jgi:alkanesulfonate monooxygenase SsuD/methylene tetrahydromethanopterin reductase-like flavin-dependent oxidoreductase (luciferase family)